MSSQLADERPMGWGRGDPAAASGRGGERAGREAAPGAFAPLQIVHGGAAHAARQGRLDAYLDRLMTLGLGGIVVNHPSEGYLQTAEGWEAMRRVVAGAAARGLRVWVYDEDGYPSGAAGGLVLAAHPESEATGVSWAWLPLDPAEAPIPDRRWRAPDMALEVLAAWRFPLAAAGRPSWEGRQRLTPEAVLGPDGEGGVGAVDPGRAAGTEAWRVGIAFTRRLYEGTHAERNFHASRRMVNVLDPEGGRAFVALTHERYAAELGPLLRHVEATFTDEPSWISAFVPPLTATRRVCDALTPPPVQYPALPWAADLPAAFTAAFGGDVLDVLPLLFETMAGAEVQARRCRAQFHALTTGLYGERYFGPIRHWARSHGIASSGHALAEEGLVSHAAFEGDTMAQLRGLDWPGCDVLTSAPPAILAGDLCLTARLAASVARLTGAPQVMCEISDHEQRQRGGAASLPAMLGTTFALCALGISVFTSYYPAEGYGEGEYRAWCLGAARACRIVRKWDPLVDVALFYPIRAVWETFVPSAEVFWRAVERDGRYQSAREVSSAFGALARCLLRRHVPFDVVDEQALLQGQVAAGADGRPALRCGGRTAYRVLLLPHGAVLTGAVQTAILRWMAAGGAVVAAGAGPAAAAGEPTLAAELQSPLRRLDSADPDLLVQRLWATGARPPRLTAVDGDASAVLAAVFRGREGERGVLLANTAPAPATVALELPGPREWRRMDLATGAVVRVPLQGPGGGPTPTYARTVVELTAYGGLWLYGPEEGPRGVAGPQAESQGPGFQAGAERSWDDPTCQLDAQEPVGLAKGVGADGVAMSVEGGASI